MRAVLFFVWVAIIGFAVHSTYARVVVNDLFQGTFDDHKNVPEARVRRGVDPMKSEVDPTGNTNSDGSSDNWDQQPNDDEELTDEFFFYTDDEFDQNNAD